MRDIPAAPEVARRLADALEMANVPYAVGGAIAYALHGPPRSTNDVGLNVFVSGDASIPSSMRSSPSPKSIGSERGKQRGSEATLRCECRACVSMYSSRPSP